MEQQQQPNQFDKDVNHLVAMLKYEIAEGFGQFPFRFDTAAIEDEAHYRLQDYIEKGLITPEEADEAFVRFVKIFGGE